MIETMAGFIDDQRDQLLTYCIEKTKTSWPGIDEKSHEAAVTSFIEHLRLTLHEDTGESYRIAQGYAAGAVLHGRRVFLGGLNAATISRDFGMVCDAVCGLAAARGVTFPARDYQTMNAMVDAAIAAGVTAYLDASDEHDETRARHETVNLEMRNAVSAARVAYAALREGIVGIRSHTGDVLDRAIARMERLLDPVD